MVANDRWKILKHAAYQAYTPGNYNQNIPETRPKPLVGKDHLPFPLLLFKEGTIHSVGGSTYGKFT